MSVLGVWMWPQSVSDFGAHNIIALFQFFTKLTHMGIAPDCQFCLQTAGLVVVTCITNRRVGPGDAGADIILFFKKQRRDIPAA